MSEPSSVFTSPTPPTPLLPNEELAGIISAALAAEGLILTGKAERVRQQLAVGSLKEEDWRFLIEEALPEPQTEVGDEQGD
jgi:hypothetical protein